MRALLPHVSAGMYSALCSVTASGPIRRPAAARSSASATPPSGLRFPFGTLRKCRASALGSRALSLGSARCDPSKIGKFNKRRHDHVSEQSNPHRLPRNDAEVRTNNNRSFAVLSLATKSSYKKDGKYISHTEWHRCVVFGKLSEFAGTLKKGAHIQVE